ncbi:hypothetical protein ALQ34_103333 [Pseudomonas syringae pv. maculicola]|nr:hypothetical protein PLA106_23408 [Pseudomonas amygdali pv. lachrymans str. M302278]RMO84570.1 hypothetical protein ALQ34_103333 [Pseudomonas syringae pv. maculicola]
MSQNLFHQLERPHILFGQSPCLIRSYQRLVFMSGLVKSTMGFEVNMDDEFQVRISNILGLVVRNSSGVAKCELRKISRTNAWVIECFWHDQQSMQAHFQSFQLQELIKLLASRSRKIVFECEGE